MIDYDYDYYYDYDYDYYYYYYYYYVLGDKYDDTIRMEMMEDVHRKGSIETLQKKVWMWKVLNFQFYRVLE